MKRRAPARAAERWLDRQKTVMYPDDLVGDELFERAVAAARAGRYPPKWSAFLSWFRSAPREDVATYIEERAAEETARLAMEAADREAERWESQAFELPDVRTRSSLGRGLSGSLVWLYHGTSTAALVDIMRFGIAPDPPARAWSDTTRGWVYVTADAGSGPCGAASYAWKASAVLGGDPVVLRLVLPWGDTSPDLDDRKLSCGWRQRRVKYRVPLEAIFEVDGDRVRPPIGPDYIRAMKLYNNPRPATPGGWFDAAGAAE